MCVAETSQMLRDLFTPCGQSGAQSPLLYRPYGWCLASGIREGAVGSWYKIPADNLHRLSLLVGVLSIKLPVEDSQESLEDGRTIREKEL